MVNDLGKIDSLTPQNHNTEQNQISNFLNLNSQAINNKIPISRDQLTDFKSKINSDIMNLSSLNQNTYNMNDFTRNKIDRFQGLDINKYRLKELYNNIDLPLINNKNLRSQQNPIENILPNKFSKSITENKYRQPNFLKKNNDNKNFKEYMIKELSNNKITKIPIINNRDTNLNDQSVYSSILQYLVYNNQIMQNIQKMLQTYQPNNNRFVDNKIESQIHKNLLNNVNKINHENHEDMDNHEFLNSILLKNNFNNFDFSKELQKNRQSTSDNIDINSLNLNEIDYDLDKDFEIMKILNDEKNLNRNTDNINTIDIFSFLNRYNDFHNKENSNFLINNNNFLSNNQ